MKAGTLTGIYAVWWREMTVFFRETPRVVSAIANPIVWLVIFGAGLGGSVTIAGLDYQSFIFAGVLVQTFLFASLFYGAYLVWDRKIDLLKAILVSPLSRDAIFVGKVLGGVTISILEAVIVVLVAALIGMQVQLTSAIIAISIVALSAISLTAIGLTIGSLMESPEGFQLLSSLVIFPLFFLSGALFPVNNLTGPLAVLSTLNPVTYIVDLLRNGLTGVHYFDIYYDLLVVLAFTVVALFAGVKAFERMKS